MIKFIRQDLRFLKSRFKVSFLSAILTNRGFHALFFYRISNTLHRFKIPLLPLIFTRIIQIFYSIDIDYRASIAGGIIIIHGVGIVIGQGAIIGSNVIIYHGVTIGRKRQILEVTDDDGFPTIEDGCVLGAGAKLLGNITVGMDCIVGPNVVLTFNLLRNSLVKVPRPVVQTINK